MQTLFSSDGISAWDFVGLSTTFVLCIAVLLSLKHRRHWLKYCSIGVLGLHWVSAIIFKPLPAKLLTTLMLASAVIVESASRRKSGAEDNR